MKLLNPLRAFLLATLLIALSGSPAVLAQQTTADVPMVKNTSQDVASKQRSRTSASSVSPMRAAQASRSGVDQLRW